MCKIYCVCGVFVDFIRAVIVRKIYTLRMSCMSSMLCTLLHLPCYGCVVCDAFLILHQFHDYYELNGPHQYFGCVKCYRGGICCECIYC